MAVSFGGGRQGGGSFGGGRQSGGGGRSTPGSARPAGTPRPASGPKPGPVSGPKPGPKIAPGPKPGPGMNRPPVPPRSSVPPRPRLFGFGLRPVIRINLPRPPRFGCYNFDTPFARQVYNIFQEYVRAYGNPYDNYSAFLPGYHEFLETAYLNEDVMHLILDVGMYAAWRREMGW